jgi:hypothetical protein
MLSCDGQCWRLITKTHTAVFDSIQLLEADQHWRVEFEQASTPTVKTPTVIGGLPVKHENPENIELEPTASYTKIKSSTVRFAAGYWAIKFNAWAGSLCPKQQTLGEYEHVGPFSSKLELNTILAKLNSQDNKAKP